MTAKIKTISFADLVQVLFSDLPERENEVLKKRNALADIAEKHTLEQIGRDFNITRERVRQIEREGLKKIKVMISEKSKSPLKDIESIVNDYLKSHGGFMAEDHLKEKLLQNKKEDELESRSLEFLLLNLLTDKFNRVKNDNEFYVIWHLDGIDLEQFLKIANSLEEIVKEHDQPITVDDLHAKFNEHDHYSHIDEHDVENEILLEVLLRINKELNKNILDQWGFNTWNTIKPKRMTDKAYLILLKEKRPLHFVEVADLINIADFDRKTACPATVHNELILDNKYVLVGRGIYALKEWGYEEGTVNDIILNILKEKGPLAKNEIIEEVLKQRLVQKTTITLSLMNKDRFLRDDMGKFSIVS